MDLDEEVSSEVTHVTPDRDLGARLSHLQRHLVRTPRMRRKSRRRVVGAVRTHAHGRIRSGPFWVFENALWDEVTPGASLIALSATLGRGVRLFSRFQCPGRQR